MYEYRYYSEDSLISRSVDCGLYLSQWVRRSW
jgi:hypothetical protein